MQSKNHIKYYQFSGVKFKNIHIRDENGSLY